ncbi:AP-4 complex subunit epsilon-1, partial [Perkinsus olseni]
PSYRTLAMLRFVNDQSSPSSSRPSPAPLDILSPKSTESVFTTTVGVSASTQTGDSADLQDGGNRPAATTTVLGPDIRCDAGIRKLASSLTKLPLGENGRMRVRRMIGQEIRKHPELRPVVRSIGKLKSASNAALVEMCIVTNTLDEARKISRAYLAKKAGKPTKRASPTAALASPYSRTSES